MGHRGGKFRLFVRHGFFGTAFRLVHRAPEGRDGRLDDFDHVPPLRRVLFFIGGSHPFEDFELHCELPFIVLQLKNAGVVRVDQGHVSVDPGVASVHTVIPRQIEMLDAGHLFFLVDIVTFFIKD